MNKNENDLKDDIEYKSFIKEVGEHFREMNERAKLQGIFTYDRETLSCPQCGLTEGIAFSGKLYAYKRGDTEFKDTGFQFIALDDRNEWFKCPLCNTKIQSPEEEG